MILVTPKQEVERKSEWFCGVKFFRSNFIQSKVRKRCLNKIRFLASRFLFTCGYFTLIYCFFQFLGQDFLLNGFPEPFIVRSRSSFLFSQWKFFELYVRTCPAMFFNPLNVLTTFFVLHKSRFSRLTSDLLHLVSIEWNNFFGHWITHCGEYGQCQKSIIKRDGINR